MYKQITAQTTDEQILAPVVKAKNDLLEMATEFAGSEFQGGERLVGAAQNVRSAEAVCQVAFEYRNVLRNTSDPQKATEYLVSVLCRGSDDTWSGRGNDSRRSANDAVRAFVTEMFDNLRFGN